MRVSPEDGQVRGLHQHLHQRVHHLGVEDDGVHHFAEFLVVGDAETGFRDAGVSLRRGRASTCYRVFVLWWWWYTSVASFKTFSRTCRQRSVVLNIHVVLNNESKCQICLHTCSLNQSSLMPLKSNTSPSSTGIREIRLDCRNLREDYCATVFKDNRQTS